MAHRRPRTLSWKLAIVVVATVVGSHVRGLRIEQPRVGRQLVAQRPLA